MEIVELAPGRSAWLPSSAGALMRLIEDAPHEFSVVTLDPPRSPEPKDEPQLYRQWLHGVDLLVECAALALEREGTVFLEIEPASLTIFLETLDRHGLHVVEAIVWQKKYSGQNSGRDLENLHDYILLAKSHPPSGPVPTPFLPYKVAGKSEDAAREFNELAESILGDRAWRAPEPLKPASLFGWLSLNRIGSTDSLLDLTSCAGSWSSQLVESCPRTVDVIWPDEPWFEASSWLLQQRLGGPRLRLSADSADREWESTACECELIARAPAASGRSNVRLNFGHQVGSSSQVEAIAGGVDDLIDVLNQHLRGRVLDSYGSLSLLANNAEGLSELLTADGVAALLLEGAWPVDLLDLSRAVGHSRVVGTVALHNDEDVGAADVMVLISARTRQYKPHPLWRARQHVYANPDADPRGPWRDKKHKGSRSGGPGTSFRLFRPPYTWALASGDLPPGLWRLNPVSGVIWGIPSTVGTWSVRVRAIDATGQSATATVSIDVVSASDANPEYATASECEWFFEPLPEGGPLRVKRRKIKLPVGHEASILMEASGGFPHKIEVPPPGRALASGGRTRYWEFNKETLVQAALSDSLIFPRKLDGKPSIREHEPRVNTRHEAMPSVMSSGGLDARDFFWDRIARSSDGDFALDWSGSRDAARVLLRNARGAGGQTGTASICNLCLDLSRWGEGCCMHHAVQPAGVLIRPGENSDPYELVDLAGHAAGALFAETPVSSETLHALEMADFTGKVLTRNGTGRSYSEVKVEKVAWRS